MLAKSTGEADDELDGVVAAGVGAVTEGATVVVGVLTGVMVAAVVLVDVEDVLVGAVTASTVQL